MILYDYIAYFFIYSFLGWVCESIYCSCLSRKIINRGFLNGPVCPVYGFGALIVILTLWPYRENYISVFVFGFILTSLLEYVTGYILEKLFDTRWWNYSDHKFNIKGRVCLLNSTLFGIMSVFVVEVIHPMILRMLSYLSSSVVHIMVILCIIAMIIDLSITLNAVSSLRLKIDTFSNILEDIKLINSKFQFWEEDEFIKKLKHSPDELIQKMKSKLYLKDKLDDKFEGKFEEAIADIHKKLSKIRSKSLIHRRLFEAFPNMKSIRSNKRNQCLQYIKKILKK